jgi:hypothetical protein
MSVPFSHPWPLHLRRSSFCNFFRPNVPSILFRKRWSVSFTTTFVNLCVHWGHLTCLSVHTIVPSVILQLTLSLNPGYRIFPTFVTFPTHGRFWWCDACPPSPIPSVQTDILNDFCTEFSKKKLSFLMKGLVFMWAAKLVVKFVLNWV